MENGDIAQGSLKIVEEVLYYQLDNLLDEGLWFGDVTYPNFNPKE
jgi:hypothetical protein